MTMIAMSAQRAVSRRGRRRPGTPCVVFIDDTRWAAFHQLAPLLGRAGVRTVRVGTGPQTASRMASRLVYDRYEVLLDPSDADGLGAILAGENVVDIQFVETLGDIVRANLAALDAWVAARVRQRLDVQDKLHAAHLFGDAGVRTPAVVPVSDVSPEDIAARFGFPVVVKQRVGSAGANVVIAGDLDGLVAAARPRDRAAANRYYEQYVDGEKLNYAAAVSATAVEQELAYRVIRWLLPAGTASEVQTISDPQLEAFGRRAIAVAGCTGLVNMDVIRDRDGCDWLIDFNARAFGGAVCFRWAGVDISQGYLRSLGQRAAAPARAKPVADVQFPVFPTCVGDAVRSGSMTRAGAAFMRASPPYLRWVGLRYWVSEALAIAHAAQSARHAPIERRIPAPPDLALVQVAATKTPEKARSSDARP